MYVLSRASRCSCNIYKHEVTTLCMSWDYYPLRKPTLKTMRKQAHSLSLFIQAIWTSQVYHASLINEKPKVPYSLHPHTKAARKKRKQHSFLKALQENPFTVLARLIEITQIQFNIKQQAGTLNKQQYNTTLDTHKERPKGSIHDRSSLKLPFKSIGTVTMWRPDNVSYQ